MKISSWQHLQAVLDGKNPAIDPKIEAYRAARASAAYWEFLESLLRPCVAFADARDPVRGLPQRESVSCRAPWVLGPMPLK